MAKRKTTLKAKRASSTAKKAAATAGVVLFLGATPAYAKPQFLLGFYPNVNIPFSVGGSPLGDSAAKGELAYGIGGTARFIVRPVPIVDVFAEGTYNVLSYPYLRDNKYLEHQKINQVNAYLGAGYNIPLNDRFSLNASMKAGVSFVNSEPILSAGASLGFSYKFHPAVSASVNVNADVNGPKIIPVGLTPGLVINLNEVFFKQNNVDIEVVDQQPVFPVFYSWYESNAFGTVRIANLEEGEIRNVKVSFFQPQYMAQPHVCWEEEVLGREEFMDVDLTAFFNERMLELTELTDTQSSVTVEYTYLGQKRRKEIPVIIPVYDRNAMNWEDDRRAASFVSSKDPAAMYFAKQVASIVSDNLRSGVPQNIQYAMGIFEALDQFGLSYVIDPTSAYSDKIGGNSIDFLQFPYQTLMYRGGDCDDISILVCSLFEAVSINTAFITVPGHIYMAFDTGVSEEDAPSQFSDLSQVIIRDGKVWMPLEVTISDEGFNKAWRVGAREWNVADINGEAALYPMAESWQIYKPVSVPGAQANFVMPEKRLIAKRFEHRIDEWVMREIEPSIREYRAVLAAKYDKAVQNNLGVLYSRYGLFSEAESEFKDLRKKGYLPAVINTANVYFAKQSYNKALASYKAVLREDPENELAVLGISRCQWELGNFRESDKYYDQLKEMNPELAGEYTYLASFTESKGRAYSLAERLDTLSWSLQHSEAMPVKEDERLKKAAVSNNEPEPEYELPPLDLTDENRFEMDNVPEEKKRETEEELLAEIQEEEREEAEAAELEPVIEQNLVLAPEDFAVEELAAAELVAELEPVSEPETLFAGELPDFLFADLKSLEPDFLVEESEEETPEEKAIAALEKENKKAEEPVYQDVWTKIVVEEKKEEEAPVVNREIPRFTESPSAEWAPEEAFTVAVIPGMRSFDEEMGNTQNEKAFLFQETEDDSDDVENFDVFASNEDTAVLAKQEEDNVEVNPFGSFFDDPLPPVLPAEELKEEIKAVSEEKNSAYEKSTEPVVTENVEAPETEEVSGTAEVSGTSAAGKVPAVEVKESAAPAIAVESAETKVSEKVENSESKTEEKSSAAESVSEKEEKESKGGIAAVVALLLSSAGALSVSLSKKKRKPESAEGNK